MAENPLFKLNPELSRREFIDVKAPERQQAILEEGKALAQSIQAVGSIVSDAVSIDEIRLSRKDADNQLIVKAEWNRKLKEYDAQLKTATREETEKIYDTMRQEMQNYVNGERSNGSKIINNNRTKKWFTDKFMTGLKEQTKTSYNIRHMELDNLDDEVNYKAGVKGLTEDALTEDDVQLAADTLPIHNKHHFGENSSQAREATKEQIKHAAYKSVINQINQYIGGARTYQQTSDLRDQINDYWAKMDDKYTMTEDQKADIKKTMESVLRLKKSELARQAEAAKKARVDQFYQVSADAENDPENFMEYVPELKKIRDSVGEDGKYLIDGKERMRMNEVVKTLENPNPKPTPNYVLDELESNRLNPDMTVEEKMDRLVELSKKYDINSKDAVKYYGEYRKELEGENIDAYKEFYRTRKAQIEAKGLPITTEMRRMSALDKVANKFPWMKNIDLGYKGMKYLTGESDLQKSEVRESLGTLADAGASMLKTRYPNLAPTIDKVMGSGLSPEEMAVKLRGIIPENVKIEINALDIVEAANTAERKEIMREFDRIMSEVERYVKNTEATVTSAQLDELFQKQYVDVLARSLEVNDEWFAGLDVNKAREAAFTSLQSARVEAEKGIESESVLGVQTLVNQLRKADIDRVKLGIGEIRRQSMEIAKQKREALQQGENTDGAQ
jgi:hypothetical protein